MIDQLKEHWVALFLLAIVIPFLGWAGLSLVGLKTESATTKAMVEQQSKRIDRIATALPEVRERFVDESLRRVFETVAVVEKPTEANGFWMRRICLISEDKNYGFKIKSRNKNDKMIVNAIRGSIHNIDSDIFTFADMQDMSSMLRENSYLSPNIDERYSLVSNIDIDAMSNILTDNHASFLHGGDRDSSLTISWRRIAKIFSGNYDRFTHCYR